MRLHDGCFKPGTTIRIQQPHYTGDTFAFGNRFINSKALLVRNNDDPFKVHSIEHKEGANAVSLINSAANEIAATFQGRQFCRLLADRDIQPENDNSELSIRANCAGVTNVIQRYLTKVEFLRRNVEANLLSDLNDVFGKDGAFTAIEVKHHNTGLWEVFLREEGKGLISLTNSGSGLKTIILVLSMFIFLPYIRNVPLSQFIFAFEELENNLHPALQRRLIQFIRKKCVDAGAMVFITTHSTSVIDLLSRDDKAQILHVTHDRKVATVRHVTTYIDNRGVLDDLDVRASELLQANGIIWVEGPTDRLFINKWITLFTNGILTEGAHYQCVFYGGRLLAHLSAATPFDESTASDDALDFGD